MIFFSRKVLERSNTVPIEDCVLCNVHSIYLFLYAHTTKQFRLVFDLLCFVVVVVWSISLPFTEFHTCHYAQHLNLLSFWMVTLCMWIFVCVCVLHHLLDEYKTHTSLKALTTSSTRHCFVSLRKWYKQNRGFFANNSFIWVHMCNNNNNENNKKSFVLSACYKCKRPVHNTFYITCHIFQKHEVQF